MNNAGSVGKSDRIFTHKTVENKGQDSDLVPQSIQDVAKVLTHHERKIGDDVLEPQTHISKLFENGNLNDSNVVNHLAESLSQGKLPPITHKDGELQESITVDNPFKKRLPQPLVDLELNKTFLGCPIIIIRELLTKALFENKAPSSLYQFLASCFGKPGGFSQSELAAIELTRLALLYEHKDKIIDLCRNSDFSSAHVASYFATNTGISLNVGQDPSSIIRLVQDGLRVGQKLLDSIPENTDKKIDEDNVITAFLSVCCDGKAGFHQQVNQMREEVFNNKYVGMQVLDFVEIDKEVFTEDSFISVFKPKSDLTNSNFLLGALIAYNKNPGDDMSASAFKKHLGESGWMKEREISEEQINAFLHDSIADCVLGSYVPACNDRKDKDEDILKEELKVYFLNTAPDEKDAYKTADSFRRYILEEHPNIQDYKLDKFLKEVISNGILAPYVPKYDDKTGIQEILREELMAHKLNRFKSFTDAINEEMVALESYLKEERNILSVKGMKEGSEQAINIRKEDLNEFLFEYMKAEFYPNYTPKYNEGTDIQKILNEELDAYMHNKPKDAGDDYDKQSSFEKYLKEERKIFEVKGMKDGVKHPNSIIQEDLDSFLKLK